MSSLLPSQYAKEPSVRAILSGAKDLQLFDGKPQMLRLAWHRRFSVLLVLGDESPRQIAERREGRGFSPAMENGLSSGALAPEATWLQGLKARPFALLEAAGLKPRPSKVRCYRRRFPSL